MFEAFSAGKMVDRPIILEVSDNEGYGESWSNFSIVTSYDSYYESYSTIHTLWLKSSMKSTPGKIYRDDISKHIRKHKSSQSNNLEKIRFGNIWREKL